MLSLKEFETSMKFVTAEDVLKNKVRGKFLPYIEMLMKKATVVPAGRSVEVDMKDHKLASQLTAALRGYLQKIGEERFVAGGYKTFVVVGKRDKKAGA